MGQFVERNLRLTVHDYITVGISLPRRRWCPRLATAKKGGNTRHLSRYLLSPLWNKALRGEEKKQEKQVTQSNANPGQDLTHAHSHITRAVAPMDKVVARPWVCIRVCHLFLLFFIRRGAVSRSLRKAKANSKKRPVVLQLLMYTQFNMLHETL